ncbi:hypothetical protein BN938_1632 [Mucinivorans hirudinis]|uniref:Uncharacterized protein n=1 Tax=Mucinivorans hirudinis TaxID=1433126 RepID=A0A060R8F1_9BACT|nr:hypothetical protein BN938_1632 [Mucinivorans hirudinis]
MVKLRSEIAKKGRFHYNLVNIWALILQTETNFDFELTINAFFCVYN